jgi:phosphoadenosine phosphosulfate reductase
MLKQQTLFGERDLVKTAIERLKFGYEVSQARGLGALYVAFSGGKDSVVIAALAEMSGVPYELHYNITGIDPPEVVYFMRNYFNHVNPKTMEVTPARKKNYTTHINLYWHLYEKSMWQLIEEKGMPPMRIMRFCCSELKEHGGNGCVIVTGVRWAESSRRASTRRQFETKVSCGAEKKMFYDNYEDREQFKHCQAKKGYVINPIVDWTDAEVWAFIKQNNLPYCELYDQGETRIGCIGCPLSHLVQQRRDFERYPKFKAAYIRTFDRMLERRPERIGTWKTGEDVFNWWISGECQSGGADNQISFLEVE